MSGRYLFYLFNSKGLLGVLLLHVLWVLYQAAKPWGTGRYLFYLFDEDSKRLRLAMDGFNASGLLEVPGDLVSGQASC